jgi:2-polyprenyl-6-methoxyphenol hydroxylase-like FAD-dependent oxidoreductase
MSMMPPTPSSDEILDVAIVGGGFAGSALAATLLALGFRVVVLEPHEVHPQDFRAEKLSPSQVEALARLGLATTVLATATAVGDLSIVRGGRVVDSRPTREYGLDYASLVQALRALTPLEKWKPRRIEAIETIDGVARVTPQGETPLRARLVVLATGQALSLRRSLGLDRVIRRENHSLSIGFDISAASRASLTYYGERIGDRIGYLTLFPIGDRLRANLFVYRDARDAWSRAFRADPVAMLDASLPMLREWLPNYAILTPPALRPIHLYDPPASGRDGVVLIGDAYSTTCPAGGGGLDKALTDIERLLEFLPRWIGERRAIGAADIAQFYADPLKLASEAEARRRAETSRASAIDPGWYWEARRRRNVYGSRVNGWLRRRLGVAPAAV